jgi:hypothetical protein
LGDLQKRHFNTTKKTLEVETWIYTSKWQKHVDKHIRQHQPSVALKLGRGTPLVQVAGRPEQDLGEVVTGSISGEVVGEVSSPWMLAEEARTDNEQFVLHASLPPVMHGHEACAPPASELDHGGRLA